MEKEKRIPTQFEIAIDLRHGIYLKKVQRYRYPGERGIWVEIGHKKEPNIQELVRTNQQLGLDVLIDEDNTYRALVCKD